MVAICHQPWKRDRQVPNKERSIRARVQPDALRKIGNEEQMWNGHAA